LPPAISVPKREKRKGREGEGKGKRKGKGRPFTQFDPFDDRICNIISPLIILGVKTRGGRGEKKGGERGRGAPLSQFISICPVRGQYPHTSWRRGEKRGKRRKGGGEREKGGKFSLLPITRLEKQGGKRGEEKKRGNFFSNFCFKSPGMTH